MRSPLQSNGSLRKRARLGSAGRFRATASGISRPRTRRPHRRSRRDRRCSRSTSARSCCCCATAARDELLAAIARIEGQLTGSIHAQPEEDAELLAVLTEELAARAGRVVYDGFPTGVAVTHGMHHGGPFPATSAPAHTSVGMTAIRRFLRPVAWQNAPAAVLPPELRDDNPLGIWRRVDGELTRDALRSAPPA